jgi:hypothetical protein
MKRRTADYYAMPKVAAGSGGAGAGG